MDIFKEYILHLGVIVALYTVEGSSNNYREPKVRGNYLRVPRRYIRPQSLQIAVFIPILSWFMYIMGK